VTAREAIARVFEDVDGPLAMSDVIVRVRALAGGDRWTDAALRSTLGALAPNTAASRHAPSTRRHGFLFALGDGRYRPWLEATDGSLAEARATAPRGTPAKREEPPPSTATPCDDLVRAFVDAVHTDPHQPHHRLAPHGDPVVGWSARAASYFWPRPVMDLRATHEVLSPWFEEAGVLSRRLAADDGWTDEERRRATVLAWQMLTWGGVTRQKEFGAPVVERVFRRALRLPGDDDAPMNSGWTKVAALATAYLEEEPGRAPHVIWDSRVSTSLVDRLEPILEDRGVAPRVALPGMGPVVGRTAGTRPRPRRLTWSTGYGSWRAQEAGSAFVRRVRDVLNEGAYGGMPLGSGGEGRWTVRGVECVLFMDGY
jgi:hypothetical protein